MTTNSEYDVAVIGGGLAGLAAAIRLGTAGRRVVLFEKETYPFHKVCGEYVSNESRGFLQSLGLPLAGLNLPQIDTLHLTAPNGAEVRARLPLGGFGISRFLLDQQLAALAKSNGVVLLQNTKVDGVQREEEVFRILYGGRETTAAVCCAAFGKRSNLDVKWKRPFTQQGQTRLNNFVGVKYHVTAPQPGNVISLHNFEGGYCGLSRIEGGEHCLCYLTKARNLKDAGNSLERMQERFLYRNPFLKKIFLQCSPVPGFPVTISQISFSPKTKVENGVLLLGDAAGMITPLCGNGMSIALHTAKMAAALIDDFLQGNISRPQLEAGYARQWKEAFAGRLRTGRLIQSFFGSNGLSNLFVGTFKAFPFLAGPVIRMTHGKPF